jgi:predicted permease
MHIALSTAGIYLFIFLGFVGKKRLGKGLDERSLVLVSIYLLQPMLVFWGLTRHPINREVIEAPAVFLIIIFFILVFTLPFAKILFDDARDRSVVTIASIVGNTGNLGIPLGMALFGEKSVIYTSIINLANVFLVYTVGVYFYARGTSTVSESVKNIFRLPAIWFGCAAIGFNLGGMHIPSSLEMPLEMGAYATMVLQLMIFGIYLATVRLHDIQWSLLFFVGGMKFIFIPFVSWKILSILNLPPILFDIILLELIVPMAVMNVNLAALYDCKADQVAFLTFATSFIFLGYLFLVSAWGFHSAVF